MATVRVATLNIFNKVGRWGERMPLLLDQLAALQPDVLALQEVDLTIDQGMSLCRLANSRLGAPPRYWVSHMARPGRAAHVQALAVMSRLPIEAHEGLDYLSYEGVAQRLRLRLPDGALLDVYNTHLYYPPEAVEERVAQVQKLLDWADTWRGSSATTVMGDFNAYPDETAVAMMKKRFASAYESAHGSEPEKTWSTPVNTFDPAPHGCLDYVFVAGAEVEEARLCFDVPHVLDEDLYPSDHLGVTATLRISERP